ncbi:MAG: TIM barrel protein, partial [Nanoarchaeota archaeon]
MVIKFGPAGLGGVKEAIPNLEKYHTLGLRACEIAFTYGVYIKNKEDAIKIGNVAKKLGISLSIHAPYWINLNSAEKEKVEKSKQRILKCLEVGTYLGASRIVFHPGYYGKIKGTKVPLINPSFKLGVMPDAKEMAYENIKNEILEIQKIRKEKKYTPKLAPETTGKVNVFGSPDDIQKLVRDTGCSFCIDFSHILARYKDYKFKEILKMFEKHENLHIHFSGIEYGEKGEKHHKRTPEKELKKLLSNLPSTKHITIISESPSPVEDSVLGL